jgi:hypothetical protein
MTKGTVFAVVKRHSDNNSNSGEQHNLCPQWNKLHSWAFVSDNANAIFADATQFSDRIFLPNTEEDMVHDKGSLQDVNNGAGVAGRLIMEQR